jgi:starvation-inducible DNA-binding protein
MQPSAAMTDPDPQHELCEALNHALADTTVTTMLAQNFHWNVTGMAFSQLHQLFQDIYEDHFQAQDDLAERIKALDGYADGNLGRILQRTEIVEHVGDASAHEMLASLLLAQETLASTVKRCGERAASHGDTLTEDLCIARGQVHEKFAWILRAHLR